jgi:hypothetical protein
MLPRTRIELFEQPGQPAGTAGLRLTGTSPDAGRLARLWLRRLDPWNRNPDPRSLSDTWDLRLFVREDSAFALQQEFAPGDLDALATAWHWPTDDGRLAALSPLGDPLYDRVLAWMQQVTRPAVRAAQDPGQAPAPELTP